MIDEDKNVVSNTLEERVDEKAPVLNLTQYRNLFNSIDEGFCVVEVCFDDNGELSQLHFREVNAAFERHTGFKDATGKSMEELLPNIEAYWLQTYADVVKTGESLRVENYVQDIDRWYSVYFFRLGEVDSRLVGVVFDDITTRKHAEFALREREEQQKFLLRLSDALRPIVEPEQILETALLIACEQLKADRVAYVEVEGEEIIVRRSYSRHRGLAPLDGRYRKESFGRHASDIFSRSGMHAAEDLINDATLPEADKAAFHAINVAAYCSVSLVKEGKQAANFNVHSAKPRKWSESDKQLIESVGERIWSAIERATSDSTMRRSEESYRRKLEQDVQQHTAALKEKNELLQAITSMVPDIITVNERTSRKLVYSNNHNLAMHGFSQDDLLRMSPEERRQLIHPEDVAVIDEYFESFTAQTTDEEIHTAEYRAKNKIGDMQCFFIRGRVFGRGADGSVDTILNVIQNITERKNSERRLNEEHRRLKEAQAIGRVGSFEWVLESGKIMWSDQMYVIHGMEPQSREITFDDVFALIHPDDWEVAMEKMIQCKTRAIPATLTYRLQLPGGGTRIVTRELKPFTNKDGEVTHINGTVQDITDQKRAEQALKESRDLLQHITEFIPDMITVQEYPGGKIIYYNRGPFKRADLDTDTILSMQAGGRNMMIYPEYVEGLQQYMASFATLGDNKVSTYEYKIRTEILDPVWVRSRGKVFERDANGNVKSILNTIQNVTEQKESERERVDRLIMLRQKDVLLQQRDEFIGIASHELKTPITSIRAYAEVIQDMLEEDGNKGHAGLMQKLNEQVDRLANLLGDLLDTTRITSGQLILRLEDFNLNELVSERVEELRRISGQRKIALNADNKMAVYADKERIGQVVTNFLSNAIKYSWDDSNIAVTIDKTEGGIKVSVRDEGVGISKENLRKIFHRFFRINSGEMKNFQGMGLGLYISAEIIRRHGGTISAESEEGNGSVFWFVLPVR